MTAASIRLALRTLHLVIGGIVGAYIYAPWGQEPAFVSTVKIGFIPLLALSGLLMWKQAWLRKIMASESRQF